MWRLPRPPLVFWFFGSFTHIITFLLAGIILDMAQVLGLILVFLYYLGGVDFNGWGTSLSISLTLLGSLGRRLISGRRGIAVLPIDVFFVLLD